MVWSISRFKISICLFMSLLLILTPVTVAQDFSVINYSKEDYREKNVEDLFINPEISESPASSSEDINLQDNLQSSDANYCSDSYPLELEKNYHSYINYYGDVDWFEWNLPSY